MFAASKHVSGGVLWANLHLLFWLSLIPFVTGWVGDDHLGPVPVAAYGTVLLSCGLAYVILSRKLSALHAHDSTLRVALRDDRKGKVSIALYCFGIALAAWWPRVACVVYAVVAAIWFIPDRRFEKTSARTGDVLG